MLPAESGCGRRCCTAAWGRPPFSSAHRSPVPVSRSKPRTGWKRPSRWYRSACWPLTSSSRWSGSCPRTSSGCPPWLSGPSSGDKARSVSVLPKTHPWRTSYSKNVMFDSTFIPYLQWFDSSLQFLQLLHPLLAFLSNLSLGDSQKFLQRKRHITHPSISLFCSECTPMLTGCTGFL